MTATETPITSSGSNLVEPEASLGPPPVLSSENIKAYEDIHRRLLECVAPKDFLEQLLVRQVADCTWEILRYTRHMTLAIERKARLNRQADAKRGKVASQSPPMPSERVTATPAREDDQALALQRNVDSMVRDVDAILNRSVEELDHARALEEMITYYQQLDQLRNAAVAGRMLALDQLDRYQRGLGRRLRKVSDSIIDAEFKEAAAPRTPLSPPLVPTSE